MAGRNNKRRQIKIQYQYDTMDCGAACLSMITTYFGCHKTRTQLSELYKGNRNGVSFLSLKRACKQVGIQAIALALSLEELEQKKHLPAILHWNDSHFVVLYDIIKSKNKIKYKVADPAFGYINFTADEMKEHWYTQNSTVGKLMTFEPIDEYQFKTKAKVKKNKHEINLLWKYFRQYSGVLVKIALCVLVVSLLQLVLPFTTQAIVDQGVGQKNISLIYLILLAQLMIISGRAVGDFIRRWLMLRISVKINLSLISDFLSKLVKLPMHFFDSKKDGDLLQRIEDHNTIETFITSKSLETIFSFATLIIFSGILLYYNSQIFLIFITGSILYGAWILLFLQKRKLLNYKFFNKRAKNQGNIYQMITGMEEMKLYSCIDRKLEEWQSIQLDLLDLHTQSLKLDQRSEVGNLLINEGKNFIITVVAASAVISGNITLGAMLSIQYIIGQLNFPVEQAANFIFAMQSVKISLNRIDDVYAREEEVTSKQFVPQQIPNGDLSFYNVSFNYEDTCKKPVINNISCNFERGKTTAIVGTSGSGKTTLIKLLLKYYTPDNGKIYLGRTECTRLNPEWWRKQCSVVMQDGFIFSDTIARNIAPTGKIITEQLLYAAKIANIYNTIQQLPKGFETTIGMDGQGLSAGQRQRLLIARAVYKNAPFVFFDEATNSLDAKNEKVIVENLKPFFKNRTVIVIAHRLSTVKNADKILVMEEGEIVETGTHTELIKAAGRYFDLVKNQLELGG